MRQVQVSKEEQVSPEEYQEVTDTAITNHFIHSIRESKYQPSPINLTQFYLRQAIKYESEIKDNTLRKILGAFLASTELSDKIH